MEGQAKGFKKYKDSTFPNQGEDFKGFLKMMNQRKVK